MSIEKILFPTDGSAFSQRALKLAIEMAKCKNARLVALHVIVVKQPKLLEAKNIEKEKARQVDVCFRNFEEEARAAGVKFETKMLVSRNVAQTILAEIEAHNPSLIVMGSHGLTGFKKILLGSVTEAVLKGSKVPLLVVK